MEIVIHINRCPMKRFIMEGYLQKTFYRLLALPTSTQNSFNPRHEFNRGKRFYNIIVYAELQAGYFIVELGFCHYEDYGNPHRLYLPHQRKTVLPGQHHVQDDEVGAVFGYTGHDVIPVVNDGSLMSRHFYMNSHEFGYRFLVLNYHYPSHFHHIFQSSLFTKRLKILLYHTRN